MPPPTTSHVRGGILYFFLFMSYGCVTPFMPLIWRSKGLSEHQVGLLGSIWPVASFFVTPVICSFADRHRIQQQVLYAALLLYSITRPSVLVAGSFLAVVAVEASCAVSTSPIGSLIDSAVIHSFGGDGYGTQRLWGAIGFGIASLISGCVSDSSAGGYGGVMAVFVAVMVGTLAASTGVPVGNEVVSGQQGEESSNDTIREIDLREKEPESDAEAFDSLLVTAGGDSNRHADGGDATSSRKGRTEHGNNGDSNGEEHTKDGKGQDIEKPGVLSAVWIMLGTARSASFFAAVGLSGMGSGVIDTFLFIRLQEMGGSHVLCGLARLIMCLAEVPFFYLSGPLIKRMGVRSVIALAQTAYLTRFIYYSILQEPWWVLPAEVLHGLTYAAMWAATTDYAHEIAPAHLRTTIQGIVSGIHWGLGFGLGAILGGVLYAGLGARLCFGVSAGLPSLSLLLLALPTIRQWYSQEGCQLWRKIRAPGQERLGGAGPYDLAPKEHEEDKDPNDHNNRSDMTGRSDDGVETTSGRHNSSPP